MSTISYHEGGLVIDREDNDGCMSPEAHHANLQHQYRNKSPIHVEQIEEYYTYNRAHDFAPQLSIDDKEGDPFSRDHRPHNKNEGNDCSSQNFDNTMAYSENSDMEETYLSSHRPVVVGYRSRYPHELRRPIQSLLAKTLTSASIGNMDEHEPFDDHLFVSNHQDQEWSPSVPRYRVEKTRSNMKVPTRPFTHSNLVREEPEIFRQSSKRPDAPKTRGRGKSPRVSKHQDKKLLPSRASGACMPWPIQEMPKLVPTEEVSDAYLQKRNLPRTTGANIVKRASGANDPENLAIVNKYDFEQKPWEAIARELNDERIKLGRVPTLTANGVILRYNRTAPIYYESIGQDFIPLKLRKRGGVPGEPIQLKDRLLVEWEPKHDDTLMRVVKQYDEAKWNTVATLMNKEFPGETFTAKNVALRFRTQ